MAQLWWQNIGDAMSGDKTPQEALDALCEEQEKVLERIEKSGVQGDIGPKMNEPQDAQVWLDAPGAPVAKLENEKPQGETISYDELIKSWQTDLTSRAGQLSPPVGFLAALQGCTKSLNAGMIATLQVSMSCLRPRPA